jgi:hypothetical protein
MAVIIALFVPRLVAVYLYFFSNWFAGVFETTLWPVLGFVFMPYTMLWYSAVTNWHGGVWGIFQMAIMAVAIIADLSSNGSAAKK